VSKSTLDLLRFHSLCYTNDRDIHRFWASQIYRLDLATGHSTRLTRGGEYNEHPVVVKTPAGDCVVFMSDKAVDRTPGHLLVGTDWWAMRLDGTGVKRLTTMNVNGSPEYTGALQVACAMAISPTGDFFYGDVQDSLTKQTGMVRVVRFTRP
jgi:Tol biopolymer transport system component